MHWSPLRSDQISHSVVSDSFRPHKSQHSRPPCPSPTPGVQWDSCPSSQWCHPAISSSAPLPGFKSCLLQLHVAVNLAIFCLGFASTKWWYNTFSHRVVIKVKKVSILNSRHVNYDNEVLGIRKEIKHSSLLWSLYSSNINITLSKQL